MPIEVKALQSLGKEHKRLGPVGVRKAARSLAERTIVEQMRGFKEWGIMGDWNSAYRTMEKGFEMMQLGVFREMVEKGRWCKELGNALGIALTS